MSKELFMFANGWIWLMCMIIFQIYIIDPIWAFFSFVISLYSFATLIYDNKDRLNIAHNRNYTKGDGA